MWYIRKIEGRLALSDKWGQSNMGPRGIEISLVTITPAYSSLSPFPTRLALVLSYLPLYKYIAYLTIQKGIFLLLEEL
jgi:hypothetical protein